MRDQPSPINENGMSVVHAISHYLYQTLTSFQHQHPDWINPRYRHIPWQQPQYQSSLVRQLNQGLSQAKSRESLLVTLKSYLNRLFSLEFVQFPEYKSLIAKLEQLTYPEIALPFANYPHPMQHLPTIYLMVEVGVKWELVFYSLMSKIYP